MMFCPSCGKTIPDESNFCLHCGKPITLGEGTPPKVPISNNPPEYIKGLQLLLNDIIDKDRKRGFVVWFQLVDKNGNPTSSDGILTISVHAAGHLFAVFKRTVQVRKDEFGHHSRNPDWFGYVFRHEQPVVPDTGSNWVDVVFKMPSGKEIKGSSYRVL